MLAVKFFELVFCAIRGRCQLLRVLVCRLHTLSEVPFLTVFELVFVGGLGREALANANRVES